MGQYYNTLIERDGIIKAYDKKLDYGYGMFLDTLPDKMAKLMEHSWWENSWLLWVCNNIYNNPAKIAWVGDYADGFTPCDTVMNAIGGKEKYDELINLAWNVKFVPNLKSVEFDMSGKYLINHDFKQFINLDTYFKNSVDKHGWCIHPLSILTCLGNGLGGGDYRPACGSTSDLVGLWAWSLLEISDDAPNGYDEIFAVFKE